MTMKKELLKGLTEEQIAKVKACANTEEVIKLAKEEGIELNDEQLEAVAGGGVCSSLTRTCPECGEYFDIYSYGNRWNCEECGCWWDENGVLEHGKKYKKKK